MQSYPHNIARLVNPGKDAMKEQNKTNPRLIAMKRRMQMQQSRNMGPKATGR